MLNIFPMKFRWQLIIVMISVVAITLSGIFYFTALISPDLPLLNNKMSSMDDK